MAASHTLPHPFAIPQISKLGVLTLYGFGIRVRMQAGHLEIEHGVGSDRHKFRLPRVNHRLKRLVCIGEDGFITLSALRWLSDIGASFIMLDRLGKVRVVTGPVSSSEVRLRRAQALALSNGTALQIASELIAAKLRGQESLVREKLHNSAAAESIAALRNLLANAGQLNEVRGIESRAAAEYWDAWRELPVLFPRKDVLLVPNHWLSFGTRCSPLTGGPRLAVNPANALLNYTNAVAESECRLAACACGLDPGLGFLHTDTANRDSLALDLIETIRPAIEAWLLDWLLREPLRKADFSESSDGNCRLSSALCSKLSETAPTWRKLIGPWAEYVAHSLYAGRTSHSRCVPGVKTPLTQRHRREAKAASVEIVKMPKTEHVCRGCGQPIRKEHDECWNCAQSRTTARISEAARIGRIAARKPQARAKLAQSARRHALARYSWDASRQPTWLTRDFFLQRIQPVLPDVSASQIRSSISVSHHYANRIRHGHVPHPRHWQALSELVEVRQAGSG
jgi:CRISPR-associated protein Cas1